MSLLASTEPMKLTVRGRYLYAIVDGLSDEWTFEFSGLDGLPVHTIGDNCSAAAVVSDMPNQKLRPDAAGWRLTMPCSRNL